jgi:aryl-alcohol dehydrogenase-like predicted oxidoreductase
MKLNDYVTLGRSGLRVSPLCLGAMTFGTDWGWGADEAACRQLFDRFVDSGGNFVDTADAYTSGRSEEMLGKFVKERKLRDRIVIATKFSFNTDSGNPNAGGNGRKNIYRAVEGSLRRLDTDYIDLYYLHAWDQVTPVEEVLTTLDDLVRQGKLRHIGLSDVPAWYATRFQTLAELHLKERLIALQLEYSLVERNIEREHLPLARELGMGVVPWSPLASGFLSGKYQRSAEASGQATGEGRLQTLKDSGNPGFAKFTPRNWEILAVLLDVARELERPPAEVALSWVVNRPGVSSTLIGATKLQQLDSNLSALGLELPAEHRARLDQASAIESIHPYMFFGEPFTSMLSGGTALGGWR